uniref:Putative secreted protein n=1 Tax=Anopheles darlingi TaxID=43151 RepID=A0A2M4DK20_ANODA
MMMMMRLCVALDAGLAPTSACVCVCACVYRISRISDSLLAEHLYAPCIHMLSSGKLDFFAAEGESSKRRKFVEHVAPRNKSANDPAILLPSRASLSLSLSRLFLVLFV